MNSPAREVEKATEVLVAYVSTPHTGYLKFFNEHKGAILYVLGKEFIAEFTALTRNLPGNDPEDVQKMVMALGIFSEVHVLTYANLDNVRSMPTIIMPDEDVSHALADKSFSEASVTFDPRWRLRWDWGATNAHYHPEAETTVSAYTLDRELTGQAFAEAQRSPDWWRQVGAVLARDGEVLLLAHNQHVPSEQSLYIYGDPRSNFGPGQSIELSSALHAERRIISEAARRGIVTEGCDLYVTTFPCPGCAYALAFTGIKRLFYAEGYSLIEGAPTLRTNGVELIRVDMTAPSS